jgi:ketopantoate reductase
MFSGIKTSSGNQTANLKGIEGLTTFELVSGIPLLSAGMACVDCRVINTLDSGAHTIFVGEVLAVAAESGIILETVNIQFKPEFYLEQKDFIAESLLNILGESHGAILPTAYQDYLQNRPLETGYINGYIVKKGYEVGIKTPLNSLLVAMMREIEEGRRAFGFENIIELNKKRDT